MSIFYGSFLAIAAYNTDSDKMTIYYENTFYGQSTKPQNMKEISLLLESIRDSLAADGNCSENAACTAATTEIAKHVINVSFSQRVGYFVCFLPFLFN